MDKDVKNAIENDFEQFFSNHNDNKPKTHNNSVRNVSKTIDTKSIENEINQISGIEIARKKTTKKSSERKPYEGHRQRVYQKVLSGAFEYFQDYEILELILFSAYTRCDTKPHAKKLIEHFGSLQNVLDASRYQITALGFPEKVATVIQIYRGVISKYLYQLCCPGDYIDTRQKAKQYMYAVFLGKKIECVCCIYMDSKKKVLGVPTFIEGGIDSVMVYTEELVREASIRRAKYILIGHNHPSGILAPSHNDIELLEEINKGIMVSRCYFYDAIITCDTGYISLAEEGYFKDNEFFKVATEVMFDDIT